MASAKELQAKVEELEAQVAELTAANEALKNGNSKAAIDAATAELTAQLADAKAEAQAAKQEAEELSAKLEAAKTKAPVSSIGKAAPSKPKTYDKPVSVEGIKVVFLVPGFYLDGVKYTAEEAAKKPDVMKSLAAQMVAGKSAFIKEFVD